MPTARPILRVPRFPIWLAVLLPLGMFLAGHGFASLAAHQPTVVSVTRYGMHTTTETETVSRMVRGRVVHLPGQQVVLRIPYIVVRTDHHRVIVPAHTVGLPSPQAAVAQPDLPVRVTVYVPTTVEVGAPPVTVTTTVTSTEILPPVTTTVTLPLGEAASS